MAERIVFAKTTRPTVTGVLDRERLYGWLDAACTSGVVWVQAPAGAGKTSLIASYIDARQRAALWYQVDAADSDPATFFAYLVREFGAHHNLPLFTAEYREDPRAFSRHFFRRLASLHSGPFLLVLDNYHELDPDAPLHGLLQQGARELPSEFCVVVMSRAVPPATFARSRANRELRLLSWPQLRLNRDETRAIVAGAGVEFSEALIDAIHHGIQGWAAALILLLEGGSVTVPTDDSASPVAPQLLFDYLAEEVYDRLPDDVRNVLLRTSCVREISETLANALGNCAHAGVLLRGLVEHHHLVSMKPSPRGPLYECHPLLREFLQRKAADELSPLDRSRLAMQAAKVLEAEGALDAAAALLLDEPLSLSNFVSRNAASMLNQGRAETLLGWMERIPDQIRQQPWLEYWHASCVFEANPIRAMGGYSRAFDGFVARGSQYTEGAALACARIMAAPIYARHEFAVLDVWIPRALSLLQDNSSQGSGEARQHLLVGLFMALVFRAPHHEAIGELAGEAFEACRCVQDTSTRTWAQLLIAINLNYTGQFDKARQFIDELRSAQEHTQASPLAVTTLKTVESMYYMLRLDPQNCLRAVFDGIEVGRETGVQVWRYHLLVNGAAAALGSGDLDTASELLQQLEQRASQAGQLDRAIFYHLTAWKFMLKGQVDDAYRQQKHAVSVAIASGCPLYVALGRLALAQVLMQRGDAREAFQHLRQVRNICRGIRNRLLYFTVNCVLADIASCAQRHGLALIALRSAFSIGREQGFAHFLWWLPDTMARLCALALDHGIEVGYARRLVQQRGLTPPRRSMRRGSWPWHFELCTLGEFRLQGDRLPHGRLSGRPLDVLKALAGLGGNEIREEAVARAVWPRIDLEYAQRSLATALHRLRKTVGHDGVVLMRHGRLSLAEDLCWLDLREFMALVADIEALDDDHAAACAVAVESFSERLFALYRGPLMHGEAGEVYSQLRERVRNALLRALDVLARQLQHIDRAQRAPILYRHAQEIDPIAEAFYRRHMLCLRGLGQNAQAVEVYGELRGMLQACGAGEPSPETRAIYEAVLRGL